MTHLFALSRTNALLRPLLAVVLSSWLAVVGWSHTPAAVTEPPASAAAAGTNAFCGPSDGTWRSTLVQMVSWRQRGGIGRKPGNAFSPFSGRLDADPDKSAAGFPLSLLAPEGGLTAWRVTRSPVRSHGRGGGNRGPPGVA